MLHILSLVQASCIYFGAQSTKLLKVAYDKGKQVHASVKVS